MAQINKKAKIIRVSKKPNYFKNFEYEKCPKTKRLDEFSYI